MNALDDFVPDIKYFAYRKCYPEWRIGKTIIDFHDLSYIIDGRGTYYVNNKQINVESGDIIYIAPGCSREARSSLDNQMEVFAINFQILDNGKMNNDSRLPFPVKKHIGLDSRLIYLYKQLTQIWIEKDDFHILDARAAVIRIVSELLKRMPSNKQPMVFDSRIEDIKYYINSNFNSEFTTKHLADMAGLNDVYLGSLFKRVVGESVKSYINKIRINHAAEIILTERASVSEVAYHCGFSDVFYFSRVFKKIKGYPPSETAKFQ